MATNMALKRAAKANRRKAVVAEKRKVELFNDMLSARVLRAALAPIQHCLVPETLFDAGIANVVRDRGISARFLHVCVFQVDTWCLGNKDTYFRSLDAEDREMMIESLDD